MKKITYEKLDERLEPFANDIESFEANAIELARELNAADTDLILKHPSSWRRDREKPAGSAVASIEEQLRREIDVLTTMSREEEARHARRIEFARHRLALCLEAEGLSAEDLEGRVSYDPTTFWEIEPTECQLTGEICRRWRELHALRTELVERNLYLVLINVERYAHLSVSRLDLIQEGSAALFRAVDGFDWRRGLLFRTYAVHWLNQAFRSFLYNFGNTVRVPVYLQKAMKHVNQAVARLGSSATADEIAEEAGLGLNLVESALGARRRTLSMDTPLAGSDEGVGLADILGEDEEVYSTEMEDISLTDGVQEAMDRLSDRERFVVEMRFGIKQEREHTLSEVASELGVSLERVRQIQVRAIGKMRTPHLRKAIDPYL